MIMIVMFCAKSNVDEQSDVRADQSKDSKRGGISLWSGSGTGSVHATSFSAGPDLPTSGGSCGTHWEGAHRPSSLFRLLD